MRMAPAKSMHKQKHLLLETALNLRHWNWSKPCLVLYLRLSHSFMRLKIEHSAAGAFFFFFFNTTLLYSVQIQNILNAIYLRNSGFSIKNNLILIFLSPQWEVHSLSLLVLWIFQPLCVPNPLPVSNMPQPGLADKPGTGTASPAGGCWPWTSTLPHENQFSFSPE